MTNKLGRPPINEKERTVKLCATVTESHATFLKGYGFGNVSLGIRRLVDERQSKDVTEDD